VTSSPAVSRSSATSTVRNCRLSPKTEEEEAQRLRGRGSGEVEMIKEKKKRANSASGEKALRQARRKPAAGKPAKRRQRLLGGQKAAGSSDRRIAQRCLLILRVLKLPRMENFNLSGGKPARILSDRTTPVLSRRWSAAGRSGGNWKNVSSNGDYRKAAGLLCSANVYDASGSG